MDNQNTAFGVTRFTKVLLDVLFVLAILGTITLPYTLRLAAKLYPTLGAHLTGQSILLMACGVGAAAIIFELRRMLRTVLAQNCFVQQNIISLRRMGYYAFGIAILSAVRLLLVCTPATLLIIGVFFLASLFSFVLSQVFDRAVRYKEENDLTI